jgi:hypothetical protein
MLLQDRFDPLPILCGNVKRIEDVPAIVRRGDGIENALQLPWGVEPFRFRLHRLAKDRLDSKSVFEVGGVCFVAA